MDFKREALLFEYFFFMPLAYNDVAAYIQSHLNSSDLLLTKTIYGSWLGSYRHKSYLFYQYQYRKHRDLTWFSFCQHYQIPEYENPSNLGLDYEWTDWRLNSQLDDHFERYQATIEEKIAIMEDNQTDSSSISDTLINYGAVIYKELDEIWFNNLINNPPELFAKLRIMPYDKKYRETSHWKRIRAAMLLINTAICQAEECLMIGESWYGGNESDLEVHHQDYKNLGNERFKDLVLLCRRHHEQIHKP